MGKIEILLPKMGESVAEATVTSIVASAGSSVDADDPIIEIATDKVDSEVPAPEDGVIVEILVNEGDVVAVGSPIAIMEVEGAGDTAAPSAPAAAPQEAPAEPAAVAANIESDIAAVQENLDKTGPSGKFYSPLVRSIAKEENISMAELESIAGSGAQGRVTKEDILAFVEGRKNGSAPAATPAAAPVKSTEVKAAPVKAAAPAPAKIQAPAVSLSGSDEVVEMGRMRKLIADHMVMSKHVSPHVTSFVEADVTNIVQWRNKVKNEFQKREGEKITFTPIFIEAIANAIKEFPEINVSVKDGDKIVYRKNINVGMATALPSGDLIVPVIKNADRFNLVGLTKAVNDLANRARVNKLKPEEIQDGTYTMTNVGSFGNVFGTPIINQPQAAIMAVGAIRKKPAVIETPSGDMIGIRHFMMLSHSYDHRVVDGGLGGKFVRRVADFLEACDPNREI